MNSEGFKETEIGLIPKDWKVDNLGNHITKIFCGRDPKGGKKSHSTENTKYRIIQSAPVFDGHLSREKVGYVKKETYLDLESASLKKDDVLLNQLGDGITFARSCIVPEDVLPAIITRSVGCIRCNKIDLDPWFLNAYLVLQKTKKYIESFNSGSSRRAIDGGKMRSFIIPLPPINEQKKIGYIHKLILDKIEINKQLNKYLEELSQTLFRHWFINFEFPNDEGKPYKSSNGEISDSDLGSIPKGWNIGTVGDIINLQGGYAFKSRDFSENGDYGVIKIKNISNNVVDIENTQFVSEEIANEVDKKFSVKSGSILIAMTGAEVAKIGIVPKSNKKLLLNQRVGMFNEKMLGGLYFIYLLLSSKKYQAFLRDMAYGSAQPNISTKDIESVNIIVPPEYLMREFYLVINPLFKLIVNNLHQNEILVNVKDSLLPKLIYGKIRVNIPEGGVQ